MKFESYKLKCKFTNYDLKFKTYSREGMGESDSATFKSVPNAIAKILAVIFLKDFISGVIAVLFLE
jgi:hypothetical protein